MRLARALMVSAFVVGLPTAAAAGTIASFSGSGTSGTDPFGHTWLVNFEDDAGNGAWGIPGLYQGVQEFLCDYCIATDFHIEFFDEEGAIDVNPDPAPISWDGSDGSTRFSSTTDQLLWSRSIIGNRVEFLAPALSSLTLGEGFFVNVVFARPIVGELSFRAEWTGTTAVPEPATLLLLGTGLGAVAARRRLRKRA